MSDVLVVTGPPGAGKSTVARVVAKGFDKAVHLHTDDFYAWIVSGYVEPWDPASQDQNVTVVDAIALVAKRFADGGYTVVLDGIVGPWFLDPFRAIGASYALLLPPVEVAHARAAARVDHPLPDLAVVGQMHAQLTARLDGYEQHVVDNAELTVEETAAEVRRRFDSGDLRLGP